jgi:hypothetical protein
MKADRNAFKADPAAGRIEPRHPDDVEGFGPVPAKQPEGVSPVRKDDSQPRDSGKPMLEKQPGTAPQVENDDRQPQSSDKVMTEEKPGSTA